MPVVSQAQNRAMHAAAEGNSTLGIPKSVGQDFVSASHGMSVSNLPQRKSDPPMAQPKTHRGKRQSTKPGASHLSALMMAHGKGDHKAAKTHALNYANALHAHMMGVAGTSGSGGKAPLGSADDSGPAKGGVETAPEEMQEVSSGTEYPPGSSHWIGAAIKHPGALHRSLGVPQGQKIPAKKIAAAANSSNPTLARRARLAQTLKSLHK